MLQIALSHGAGRSVGVDDISYIHLLFALQGYGNNVAAVKVLAEHTGRYGIAVQAYEEIEKSRSVRNDNALGSILVIWSSSAK